MFFFYITFSLVLVGLSYFLNKNDKYGLFFSFIILFIFLGIRYDFGFDYKMYEKEFFIINFKPNEINEGMKRLEVGWVILNQTFKYIGFKGLIVFHSIIYCFSMFLFFDTFYQSRINKTLALFFLLVSPGALILHLCFLRQSLALSLVLISLVLIYKDFKFYFSILLLLLAATFHLSALLFIPIFLMKYLKGTKMVYITFSLISIILIIMISILNLRNVLFNSVEFLFPKYFHYLTSSENINNLKLNTGLGLVFLGINFVLLLSRIQFFFWGNKYKIVFISGIMFFIISTISFQYFFFSRLLIYFEFFYLLLIPLICDTIIKKSIRYSYIIFQIIFYIYSCFIFFESDKNGHNYFSKFNTIFSNL